MRTAILLTTLALGRALAQPTVAPTPEPVGPPRGENIGAYNVSNSFELGYRFRSIGGNLGKYRSDVNFGNGIRLLGSRLQMNSRDGRGRLFDELSLTTQGLGNDPYQSAILRLEKNRIYRYDLSWRLAEYYNPALAISAGQHLLDTRRRFQDHDITLFPQSSFKLFAGYTRNSQTGPGLSTTQIFDSRGDEFALFQDIRRQRNEYRLGGEATVSGFTLNVLRGWDNFKDDTPTGNPLLSAGNNSTDQTTLSSFRRAEPYHGNSPYWRLFLTRNTRRFSMNARYSNVSGRRNFLLDETAIGTDRLGAARNRQILSFGAGSRPVVAASLNFSVHPTQKFSITNHTGFHNSRMSGDASFLEVSNGRAGAQILDFQYLGIRAIQSITDALYSPSARFGLYGGYHFSTRRIQSREGQSFDGFTDSAFFEQTNRMHSGLGGLRLRPVKPLTMQIDTEIGRAGRPFYPISERNYHAVNGRVQYRARNFSFSAQTRTLYNTNSVSLFAHSSRSRQYTFDGSWTPGSRFSIDAGYGKLHLHTTTGIAYFAASQLVEGSKSIYISNLHTGHLGMRIVLHKRADLYAGYSVVRDAGDGRAAPATGTVDDGARLVFLNAQTFPLSYQTPLLRLSVRLHNKLRWNLGYQHYSYHEDFSRSFYQNYRGHTGYVSLLWSF
jgi:hypothetical protein